MGGRVNQSCVTAVLSSDACCFRHCIRERKQGGLKLDRISCNYKVTGLIQTHKAFSAHS